MRQFFILSALCVGMAALTPAHAGEKVWIISLKNTGASNTTSMAILGHDNEEVHQIYGDVEADTIRKALNKLPDITKG